jgi:hypothetical protein
VQWELGVQLWRRSIATLRRFTAPSSTPNSHFTPTRHYIGIEIDPKYAGIAKDRLKGKAAPPED